MSTYEEHEDSVYAAEWSSADPWLFASLSYDGRLVINRVPRALKYRILLWARGGKVIKCEWNVRVCSVSVWQLGAVSVHVKAAMEKTLFVRVCVI